MKPPTLAVKPRCPACPAGISSICQQLPIIYGGGDPLVTGGGQALAWERAHREMVAVGLDNFINTVTGELLPGLQLYVRPRLSDLLHNPGMRSSVCRPSRIALLTEVGSASGPTWVTSVQKAAGVC